ncbi:hypothetical protein N9X61_01670 [Sulfurimonas sp.]|nr:hypothetical protein [Sulfurimonas sp.]
MKKFITMLCVIGVTVSLAQEGSNSKKEGPKHDCKPPKEAIEVCLGQASDATCQVTGRHGDILNGTCKYTPDEKYFVCAPEKGPRRNK